MKQVFFLLIICSTIFALEPKEPNDSCLVENCLLCPEKADTCTMCKPEYYLSENTCNDCPINCKYCTGGKSADCTQCIEKHAFNKENLCINIGIDDCLKAKDSSSCQECLPEFYLSNNTCLDCAINCKTCTGPEFSDCKYCNQLYALDKENYCQLVNVENCWKTDETGTKCGECLKGYKLKDTQCISSSTTFKLGLLILLFSLFLLF